MPEGPEVSILAKELNSELAECVVDKFIIHGKESLALQKSIKEIASKLAFPLLIKGVRKKGKFLYFWLEDSGGAERFLGNSLGLSGRWAVEANKYSVVEFKLRDCAKVSRVYYNDKRHFGKFMLFEDLPSIEAKLDNLGGDILGNVKALEPVLTRPGASKVAKGDVAQFSMLAKAQEKFPKKEIVKVLMDQKVISGVGNYLKAEGLYTSRIYPGDKIGKLEESDLKNLFEKLKKIAKESYEDHGVSTQDFLDFYGSEGEMTLKVYKKKKDPKGNKVQAKKFSDGRTTYFVPSLQKN